MLRLFNILFIGENQSSHFPVKNQKDIMWFLLVSPSYLILYYTTIQVDREQTPEILEVVN